MEQGPSDRLPPDDPANIPEGRVVHITTGPFKGRSYSRVNGQWRRVHKKASRATTADDVRGAR